MRHIPLAVTALVSFLPWSPLGLAQEQILTLDQALALARSRAPAILSARARIDEARGRLTGASTLLRDNPVVESAAGPRFSDRRNLVDADFGVRQVFELGGRRGARIAGAEAGVSEASAGSDDATRRLLRDVSRAFLVALHAGEGLRLAADSEGIATEILRTAERRFQSGEVLVLDVNAARVAVARARSELRAAEAGQEAALGALRILLGMRPADRMNVRGELGDRHRFDLRELVARAPDRADLRALQAGIDEAEAEYRLGMGRAWPDLGVGVRYERDGGDDVVLGGVSLTLPVFDRGQGQQAEASARARRLRLELETGRQVVSVEVQTAFDVYQRRIEAVTELERDALPFLDENESLSRRSYESGQIGLVELLLLRREILEVRVLHLDRQLEAALSGVELEASAGVLP
jgi:outer membrane protein, heavy metal efflux system